jgi:2'-5' RNA ligase
MAGNLTQASVPPIDAHRPADNGGMRLFLALWPDAAVRQRLVDALSAWVWPPRAVVVPPERLHLTLHFLGQVADTDTSALRRRLPPLPMPFELDFGRAALWPQGIAVLEPLSVPPGLVALHAALADTLHGIGLRTDPRPLRPHVTLARHAQGTCLPATGLRWAWPVNGYALVHSVSGPPLRYELLQRVGP